MSVMKRHPTYMGQSQQSRRGRAMLARLHEVLRKPWQGPIPRVPEFDRRYYSSSEMPPSDDERHRTHDTLAPSSPRPSTSLGTPSTTPTPNVRRPTTPPARSNSPPRRTARSPSLDGDHERRGGSNRNIHRDANDRCPWHYKAPKDQGHPFTGHYVCEAGDSFGGEGSPYQYHVHTTGQTLICTFNFKDLDRQDGTAHHMS